MGGSIAQAWSGLAGALYHKGKVKEAGQVLREALSVEPDPQKGINIGADPLICVYDAFILALRGRPAESAAAFMK
eukprot:scaffold583904_cov33-Prasinocladus_malaysianus.AAC.1